MTHTEIVMKLIGSIQPTGESNTDAQRFENLKELCSLINNLVTEIDDMAYRNKDAYEASVKKASEYAQNFLTNTLGIVY